jgi:hypothetical protein
MTYENLGNLQSKMTMYNSFREDGFKKMYSSMDSDTHDATYSQNGDVLLFTELMKNPSISFFIIESSHDNYRDMRTAANNCMVKITEVVEMIDSEIAR